LHILPHEGASSSLYWVVSVPFAPKSFTFDEGLNQNLTRRHGGTAMNENETGATVLYLKLTNTKL
jgi:hypothetical protein